MSLDLLSALCPSSSPLLLLLLTLLPALACLLGDHLLSWIHLPPLRAFSDSVTHASVASLSWATLLYLTSLSSASSYPPYPPLCSLPAVPQLLLAGLVAAILDVDHFVAARSLRLSDALSLTHRPALHNTPLIIALTIVMTAGMKLAGTSRYYYLSKLFLLSSLSHHVRDGTRRGMYMFPLPDTPRIPHTLYIVITCLLPYVMQANVWVHSVNVLLKRQALDTYHVV